MHYNFYIFNKSLIETLQNSNPLDTGSTIPCCFNISHPSLYHLKKLSMNAPRGVGVVFIFGHVDMCSSISTMYSVR